MYEFTSLLDINVIDYTSIYPYAINAEIRLSRFMEILMIPIRIRQLGLRAIILLFQFPSAGQ